MLTVLYVLYCTGTVSVTRKREKSFTGRGGFPNIEWNNPMSKRKLLRGCIDEVKPDETSGMTSQMFCMARLDRAQQGQRWTLQYDDAVADGKA